MCLFSFIRPIAVLWFGLWLLACHRQAPSSPFKEQALYPPSDSGFAGIARPSIESDKPPTRLQFDLFSTEDGLCSNSILSLLVDKQGFLWVGTDDGLNCYDGYTFHAFRHQDNDPRSLPANAINAMVADNNSGVWVLTSRGLSHVSATQNEVVSYPADSVLLAGIDLINAHIVSGGRDTIWMRGLGVTGFDLRTKHYFSVLRKLYHDFLVDAEGRVYDITAADSIKPNSTEHLTRGFLKLYDRKTDQFQTLFDTMQGEICQPIAMATNGDGRLVFTYSSGDVAIFTPSTRQWEYREHCPPGQGRRLGLGSTSLDCHYGMRSRMIWLAGFNGIVRINLNPGARVPVIRYALDERDPKALKEKVCTAVLEDRAGNIWVGTEGGGLYKYAPSANKFDCYGFYFRDSTSLLSPRIEALHFDHKDRLWIATNRGINRMSDRASAQFETYLPPAPKTFAHNYSWVKSIAEDTTSGLLYLAYWGSPPNIFNPETQQFEPLPIKNGERDAFDSLGGAFFINQVVSDQKGNFFYADWDGLLHMYNVKKQTFYSAFEIDATVPKPQISGLSRCIIPFGDSCVWLGYEVDQGIQMLDLKQGTQLHFRGPYRPDYNPDLFSKGRFTNYLSVPGDSTRLQGGATNCFYVDRQKRLWVGAATGLYLLEDQERGIFRRYGRSQGFPNEVIQSIMEDDHGRFWIGTNQGLCCFDPVAGRVLRKFGRNDGLFGSQFSTDCCSRSRQGIMAFGGPGGIIVFHPDSLYINRCIPEIRLTAVLANNHAIPFLDKNIILPYDSNSLTLHFTALDYARTSENRYCYRIHGPNFQQEGLLIQPLLQLFNLAPGRYDITLNGSNNDGIWGEELHLSIRIDSPWWFQSWFMVLAGIFMGGLFLWVFRLRVAAVRKDSNRERTIKYLQAQSLQAQLNPHFIFNVLTTMQSKILDNSPQEASRMLVDLSKLIRNFLEASISTNLHVSGDFDEISLDKEIELLEMYVGFECLKNDYRFHFDGVKLQGSIEPGNESLPPIILQPYVENAIKHGLLYRNDDLGKLFITFSKTGEDIICTIEDNGVGRKKAREIQHQDSQVYRSRGTELVEKRIAILNQISYNILTKITDRPGGGTVVVIHVGYKQEPIL